MSENSDAIEHLLEYEERSLTIWEICFLENIDGRESLTRGQQEALDKIWDEVVVRRMRRS